MAGAMILERTYDENTIRAIVAHPKIYPWIAEDGAPSPENWRPVLMDSVYYLLVKEITKQNPIILGLFAVVPSTTSCVYQVHACLLPGGRGPSGRVAAQECLAWVWRNIPSCMRLTGEVPAFNRLSCSFAQRAFGMTRFGLNSKSFLKHGLYHDLILFGITRPGI